MHNNYQQHAKQGLCYYRQNTRISGSDFARDQRSEIRALNPELLEICGLSHSSRFSTPQNGVNVRMWGVEGGCQTRNGPLRKGPFFLQLVAEFTTPQKCTYQFYEGKFYPQKCKVCSLQARTRFCSLGVLGAAPRRRVSSPQVHGSA